MQKRKGFASIRQITPLLFVSSIIASCISWVTLNFSLPAIIIFGLYLSTSTIATLDILVKNIDSFLSIILLPITYFAMHIGYGFGSLCGLIYFINKWDDTEIKDEHFEREKFAKAAPL